MSTWRPAQEISVKAVGLLWRDGKLLAAEVRDDEGQLTGVRPLGGSVNFGETAEQAVRREFAEELGLLVTPASPPIIIENIYSEIVFVFGLSCADGALPATPSFQFCEEDGSAAVAAWYDPADLDQPNGPRLFPAGLKAVLPPFV